MNSDVEKKYYKISQVADMLGVTTTTLRYWEDHFSLIKPTRTKGGTRFYTPADIEKLRMVHYLVKEKGMKIEKAQEALKHNHDGVSKRYRAVKRLKEIRSQLLDLLHAIDENRPTPSPIKQD